MLHLKQFVAPQVASLAAKYRQHKNTSGRRLETRRSKVHAYGLFTLQPISADDVVSAVVMDSFLWLDYGPICIRLLNTSGN